MLRSLRFWLGMAISAFFLALVFLRADPRRVLDALRGADYIWFLPAIALYLVSVYIRSIRYRFLVRDLADIPAYKLFPVLCIAFMANNVLPARAGELVRAYVMGQKYGVSKLSALGTVLVERLFDGLTLLLFLLGTVLVLGADATLRGLAVVSLAVFLAALAIFAAILCWPDRSEAVLHRIVALLPNRFRPLGRDLTSSLLGGMVALRRPDALLVVIFASPLVWLMEACTFLLVGRSFGMHLSLGWFMMAMAAGNLALTAPSSAGGIGPFEFFAKQVLVFAGVANGVAAAYALAIHAVIILPVTIIGLVFLPTVDISLRRAMRNEANPAGEPDPEAALKTDEIRTPAGRARVR